MSLFDEPSLPAGVRDLKPGQRINHPLKVLAVQKRHKKNGDPFLALDLMDPTEKIPGKIWQQANTFYSKLKAGEIYRIQGIIHTYQGKREIRVEGVADLGVKEREAWQGMFVEPAPFDIEERYGNMMGFIRTQLKQDHLLKLVELFDETHGETFRSHYGAQKIHHAYPGGLLDHTDSVIRLAVAVADHHGLDRELLVIGGLFHDIGKLQEYRVEPAPAVTEEGGLIGHIVLGNQMFLALKNRIKDFPEQDSLQIQHMIISHHGEKEFGAPEVPKTSESFVLHLIDMLDSKLKMFKDALEDRDSTIPFTEYVHYLGRRIYAPTEPGDPEPEARDT